MIFYAISDRNVNKKKSLSLQLRKYINYGVDFILIREKDLSDSEIFSFAKKFAPICKNEGIRLFIHKRADIASLSGADGVHLPENSIPIGQIKKKFKKLLIIKSCHSLKAIMNAQEEGADFVTFSPIFETPSKKGILSPVGLKNLEDAVKSVKIPIIALGGIVSIDKIEKVKETGVYGIASIRLFNEIQGKYLKHLKGGFNEERE